jgi:glycosyltransferase involved in cell wall biosynthesis
MKITFPVFGLGGSGGDKGLVRIANGLVDRGHDVSFVLPKNTYSKIYPTKAKLIETLPLTIKYEQFNLPYIDFVSPFISLVPRIPKSDIICANYCMTALPTIISAKVLNKGVPFYFVQHYESLFFPRSLQFGYRWYVKNTYNYFGNNIITVSKWLGDAIFNHTGKKPVVVHPAVDLDIFRPRETQKRDTKTILCLGVNVAWKGNLDVINAMKIVNKKYEKMKLVIVGRSKIKVNASIPHEQRQANDEELAELYSSCDVYLLGSWYEGFPAPPLEAMACGAPVVCTDNLGIREYGINEENCLIVPPKQPEAMADAILRLLSDEDLCEKFREAGPKTAKQFTWDKTADKVESVFKEALNKI